MIFFSFIAPRVNHCSRVQFLCIFAQRLRCQIYFYDIIIDPLIDHLHITVVTQNQLGFQASPPEVAQ